MTRWNKIIPRWEGDIVEPPESMKTRGYKVEDRPPAKWENWFRKGVYEAIKENREEIDLVYLAKADLDYVTSQFTSTNSLKADKTYVDSQVSPKANTTTVNNALALKADTSAVTTALNLKADNTALSGHTGNKGNPHEVTKAQVGLDRVNNTNDAEKPISNLALTEFNKKAYITYVDGRDNLKANITDVNSGLELKADTTYVNQKLALKADITYVDNAVRGVVSESGMQDYIDNAVSPKADISYVDSNILGIVETLYPVGSIYTSVKNHNPNYLFGMGTWVSFGAGKVLVGVDTAQTEFSTVKKTGGTKTEKISVAQLPSHGHNVNVDSGGVHLHTAGSSSTGYHKHTASSGNSGEHGHSASSADAGIHGHSASSGTTGNHAHSGTTASSGTHNHTVRGVAGGEGVWSGGCSGSGSAGDKATSSDGSHTHTFGTNTTGDHSHTISVANSTAHKHTISIVNSGAHNHTVSIGSNGTHDHVITVANSEAHSHTASCSNTGGDAALNNLQPFITVYMWERTA